MAAGMRQTRSPGSIATPQRKHVVHVMVVVRAGKLLEVVRALRARARFTRPAPGQRRAIRTPMILMTTSSSTKVNQIDLRETMNHLQMRKLQTLPLFHYGHSLLGVAPRSGRANRYFEVSAKSCDCALRHCSLNSHRILLWDQVDCLRVRGALPSASVGQHFRSLSRRGTGRARGPRERPTPCIGHRVSAVTSRPPWR